MDDFEDGYDPRWSPVTTPDTSLTVSNAAAHSGSSSLRLEFIGTGRVYNHAYLRLANAGAPYEQAHYGRAYIRLSAARPGNEGLLHWDFVHAAGESPSKQFRYGAISDPGDNNRHTWLWNHETWPRPPGFNEIGVGDLGSSVPAQTWICVEWSFNGATNESRFWENGVAKPEVSTTSPVNGQAFTMPNFTAIEVGLWGYQQRQANMVMFIDDVAIASQRIGCME